jgi:serine protease inhibitor
MFNQWTSLVVLSSIYLKCNWSKTFEVTRGERLFFKDEKSHIKMKFMEKSGMIAYADLEFLNAQILELDYSVN